MAQEKKNGKTFFSLRGDGKLENSKCTDGGIQLQGAGQARTARKTAD